LLFLKFRNLFNGRYVWFWMDWKKLIIGVVVFIILLAMALLLFNGESVKDLEKCVPASCCHSKSCVWESERPDCGERFCTMSCEPETMDCGQGHCEVVDGSCEVVWNE